MPALPGRAQGACRGQQAQLTRPARLSEEGSSVSDSLPQRARALFCSVPALSFSVRGGEGKQRAGTQGCHHRTTNRTHFCPVCVSSCCPRILLGHSSARLGWVESCFLKRGHVNWAAIRDSGHFCADILVPRHVLLSGALITVRPGPRHPSSGSCFLRPSCPSPVACLSPVTALTVVSTAAWGQERDWPPFPPSPSTLEGGPGPDAGHVPGS